jgi:very-short-patch-repair endonuclease
MVAIELDGARFHTSAGARARDRKRENELVALGWRVFRFTWGDVIERGERVLALMRASCATIRPHERIDKGA